MQELKQLIRDYKSEYLILDGKVPTISLGYVIEEFMIYNISNDKFNVILNMFYEITGKKINLYSSISSLSHGQKLILSILIVLESDATHILLNKMFISISNENINKLNILINNKIVIGKKIIKK